MICLRYLIFSACLVMISVSCVERIDIELDEGSVMLVVEGAITTDTMSHTITLTKTTSYYYNQPPPAVTGALVQISDGQTIFDLPEYQPGIYRTAPSVYGVAGRKYTLFIRLAEEVGGHLEYTAEAELSPVNSLDSIGLEFHPDWSDEGIWEVQCYVQDPVTADFYRFMISKNSTVLTDTLSEWFVTDDRFFNGNYAFGAPVGYLNQGKAEERLLTGDTVRLEMNSIGSGYAYFIWDAQSEVRGSYPLFSGPPANVRGNINNGAFGFFAAYSITRSETVVKASP